MHEMPVLETKRLLLRPFVLGDLDDYHRQLLGDVDVTTTLRVGKPLSQAETEAVLNRRIAHWEKHGFGLWAVIHKQDAQLVGQCGFQFLDNTPEVELTYAIAKAYWNQGLTTEAVEAVLRYGFEELRLDRIAAVTTPTNFASQRVMTKVGMKYEKNVHYYDGREVVYYALSRQQFTDININGLEGAQT